MNREERVNELLSEIDTWVRPAAGVAEADTVLLATIPMSSKLMREVRRGMDNILNDINSTPELKEHVRSVMRGEKEFSSLLEPGIFPVPAQKRIPAEMRDVIESVREGEIK